MFYFRVHTSIANQKLKSTHVMKDELPPVSLLQPPKPVALSLLLVDFRVHTLLTNHQNYKLVFAKSLCLMKYALPQAQLPRSLPFYYDVRVSILFTNQKLQIGSAKSKFCYKTCIATGPPLAPKKLTLSLYYLWMLGCSPHLKIKISNWFCQAYVSCKKMYYLVYPLYLYYW